MEEDASSPRASPKRERRDEGGMVAAGSSTGRKARRSRMKG